MSQPKSRDVLRWRDDSGKVRESASWKPTRGASLSNLSDRIVDAYCPAGHLTACLVPSSDQARPLVMVHNASTGPSVMLVLADGGLCGAFVSAGGLVSQLGSPLPDFVVDCATCVTGFLLDATALDAAFRDYAGKTRRLGLAAIV